MHCIGKTCTVPAGPSSNEGPPLTKRTQIFTSSSFRNYDFTILRLIGYSKVGCRF
jgi:hypothetical protein